MGSLIRHVSIPAGFIGNTAVLMPGLSGANISVLGLINSETFVGVEGSPACSDFGIWDSQGSIPNGVNAANFQFSVAGGNSVGVIDPNFLMVPSGLTVPNIANVVAGVSFDLVSSAGPGGIAAPVICTVCDNQVSDGQILRLFDVPVGFVGAINFAHGMTAAQFMTRYVHDSLALVHGDSYGMCDAALNQIVFTKTVDGGASMSRRQYIGSVVLGPDIRIVVTGLNPLALNVTLNTRVNPFYFIGLLSK